jgi:lactate dehydrogenase-like 2-hydroxyacid dehydrogenase
VIENWLREGPLDGIYCVTATKIDGALLDLKPSLKVVSTMSVGFDHIGILSL